MKIILIRILNKIINNKIVKINNNNNSKIS